MSSKLVWDGEALESNETSFTYKRTRLESAIMDTKLWDPNDTYGVLEHDRFAEGYAYNLFGERIGVQQCTRDHENVLGPGLFDDYPLAMASCKAKVRVYDYVDGRLLVERESDNFFGGLEKERNVSVYTWGAVGLIARRGVSVRDGTYDGQTHQFTATDPPNPLCNYTYMMDHMGNVAGLVDSGAGTARRQVFDAFGNVIDGFITFRCASDYDFGEWLAGRSCIPPEQDCLGTPTSCNPPCPDPLPDAAPIERMQAGGFNWRGGEGSVTDRVAEDQREEDPVTYQAGEPLIFSSYTRPSTGLIYMQARYYEPETGRFTQSDSMPYGFESLLTGQNNRWTYCANDPVNCSDPSGLIPLLVVLAILDIIALFVSGADLASNGCTAPGFLAFAISAVGMVLLAIADAAALAAAMTIILNFAIGFMIGVLIGLIVLAIAEALFADASDRKQPMQREELEEYSSHNEFYCRTRFLDRIVA